jgi:hypothetical protein
MSIKYVKQGAAILVAVIIMSTATGIWLSRYYVERDLNEARRKPIEKGQQCGGGFLELSPDFKNQYLKQISKMRDSEAPEVSKEDIPFYGFVYAPTKRDLKAGETESYPGCAEIASLTPDDVIFAGPEVNTLLRRYISAVTFNEKALSRARPLVAGGVSIAEQKIDLCMTLDCGESRQLSGYQTFNFVREADLKYARAVSDNDLSVWTAIKLEKTPFRANSGNLIDENTINGLLICARRTALARSKE